MKEYPRIVFFGTPDFAVASLKRLVEGGYCIAAVVTAPDKPAGRGLAMNISPVKKFALESGLPVLQPLNMKDHAFIAELGAFRPDLQIVIAFRMMPVAVWSFPPLGTFNLHASLLPQYRGAAPINRAVMNGETETGLTTFFLNEQIDTGRILFVEKTPIGPGETAGELHDRLMEMGAGLVIRTVESIRSGIAKDIPQESLVQHGVVLRTAPKIFKEDCRIDWEGHTYNIYNQIRGLSPYPGAFCEFTGRDGILHTLKIFSATPEVIHTGLVPGRFITDGKSGLKISANDGFLHITCVQLAGRKPMTIGDFLRGYGSIFS